MSVCPSDGDSVDHTLVLATSGQQASKPSSAFKTPPFAVVARGGRERELQLPELPLGRSWAAASSDGDGV